MWHSCMVCLKESDLWWRCKILQVAIGRSASTFPIHQALSGYHFGSGVALSYVSNPMQSLLSWKLTDPIRVPRAEASKVPEYPLFILLYRCFAYPYPHQSIVVTHRPSSWFTSRPFKGTNFQNASRHTGSRREGHPQVRKEVLSQ